MVNSSFAIWNFLEFFFQIFSIRGWLNPQMWNAGIWRADCIKFALAVLTSRAENNSTKLEIIWSSFSLMWYTSN